MTMINKAIEFAIAKHKNHLDDDGKDYFFAHLLPVLEMLQVITNDETVLCAGVLHDTIEDTGTTYEELEQNFGRGIADLVYEVTHEGRPDTKGYYFPRLKSANAILIKLIDRASNISRMNSWPEKKKQDYLRKTKFWQTE